MLEEQHRDSSSIADDWFPPGNERNDHGYSDPKVADIDDGTGSSSEYHSFDDSYPPSEYTNQFPGDRANQPFDSSNHSPGYSHPDHDHPQEASTREQPRPSDNTGFNRENRSSTGYSPSSSRSPGSTRRDKSGNARKLITWKKLPGSELHPLHQKPKLPEGWDWTYARGKEEKRCFWKPPKEEKDSGHILPPGWDRHCTIFGRIYWKHRASKLVSYEHPALCRQFMHLDGELLLRLNDGGNAFRK